MQNSKGPYAMPQRRWKRCHRVVWKEILKSKILSWVSLLLKWKKRSEETQTLRAGCSKAESKLFAPPQSAQIPVPGARDGQNLIGWRWSLPLPTNPVSWGLMHAISSYRCSRPTHRQDRLQYTAPQLRACSVTRITGSSTSRCVHDIVLFCTCIWFYENSPCVMFLHTGPIPYTSEAQ